MTDRSLVFRTPPDSIEVVHSMLEELWEDAGTPEDMDRMAFETALIELASNVLQHATSTTTIVCRLDVSTDDDGMRAVLTDTADPPEVDDGPREMPDEFAESGRGLAFIEALVTSFQYERSAGRNIWTLERVRSAPDQ